MEIISYWITRFFRFCSTYPLLGVAIIITYTFLFLLLVAHLLYEPAVRAKVEYEQQKKENAKLVQAVLSNSEKHDKLSAAAQDAADKLSQSNARLAEIQTKKDSELSHVISKTESEGQKERDEINKIYNEDINSISNMSELEREHDICSRIERLYKTNPELANFRCDNFARPPEEK